MNALNLAYQVEQSGENLQPLIELVKQHVVPLAIVAGVGLWAIYFVWAYRWSKRQPRESSAEKATLRGTGQVLSFKQTKETDWSAASQSYFLLVGKWGNRRRKKAAHFYCKIELAVNIPGREQYVAVVRKALGPGERDAMQQPGKIVPVAVDPDGDPRNVRINLDDPVASP